MVITETWLHPNILDTEITPPNYTIIRKDREARGGGVAILIRRGIVFTVLDEVKDIEAVWVQIRMSDHVVVLGGVYRPPNSSANFLIRLRQYMDYVICHNKNILLVGDFNLPGIDWNKLSAGAIEVANCEQLLEIAFCYNLSQVVTEHTRTTSAASSLLDLMFVSANLTSLLSECETLEGISDHKMTCMTLNLRPSTLFRPPNKKVLVFEAADDVSILDYLEKSLDDFQSLYQLSADTEVLWDFFANVIAHCVSLFVPTRVKMIRNKNPWITREIIHVKRKIKRCRKANTLKPNDYRKMTLQSLSRELKRLVKDSKAKFYNVTLKKFLIEAPAKFWRYVNPKTKKEVNSHDSQLQTEEFNSFFFHLCLPKTTSIYREVETSLIVLQLVIY